MLRIGSTIVRKEKDVVKVRQDIKTLCDKIGFNHTDAIKIITVVSELTINLYEQLYGENQDIQQINLHLEVDQIQEK